MTEWLNTILGADTATYLGLFAGIVSLVIGGNRYKKWKQNNFKQNAKNIHGDVNQAGRDINHYHSANDAEENKLKKSMNMI